MYNSLTVAKGIARRYANRSGTPWAIVGRDGLSVIRWEIMPATLGQLVGGEAGIIVMPNRRAVEVAA